MSTKIIRHVETVIFPRPAPGDIGWRPRDRAGLMTYRLPIYAITQGMRFGRLITVSESWLRERDSVRFIDVECDCGNRLTVRCGNLANGRSLSCGCFHRERVSADASESYDERISGKVRDLNGRWIAA